MDRPRVLVATGLVPNHFILDLNRALTNPHDEALPSRLFHFPIAFEARKMGEGKSRLLLRHPALADHPFVQQVAAQTGEVPVWEPLDELGRDRGAQGRWWHAVDLMTEAHWRDLLATCHFTDDDAIAGADVFALECGERISVSTAREVLATLEVDEPANRSHGLLMSEGIQPTHIAEHHPRTGKLIREHWPLNVMERNAAGAWLVVHGIEDGWFERRRDGHLQLSREGRRRRPEWRLGALRAALNATSNNEAAFHEAFSALEADADVVDAAAAATLARTYTGEDHDWDTRETALGGIEAEFYRQLSAKHEVEDEQEHGWGR